MLIVVLLAFSIIAPACVPATPSKPTIILASPPHGSEFREGDTVTIQSASGDAAGIARVELLVDGALVRSDAAPSPQTYFNVVQNWKATPGKHTITVRAYNTAGAVSDPSAVSISVGSAATPVAVATATPRQLPSPSLIAAMPTTLPTRTSVAPQVTNPASCPGLTAGEQTKMATKHEGEVLYSKRCNYWVRVGVKADMRSARFFRDYEKANADTDKLFNDIGLPRKKLETEEEVWNGVGIVWNWLKSDKNIRYSTDDDDVKKLTSVPDEWPSVLDYASYYVRNGRLVWFACFSKAHLFATLIGKLDTPRSRFSIAETHHTENGVPPTATHVYVAVYLSDRWFYLDPTAATSKNFPDYEHRQSIGVDSFKTVDYEHPYTLIPVPGSAFEWVPFLPK